MTGQGLASFSSGAIAPAPSFADFRFSTIGQDPLLLKRMQAPDLHDNGSPCPSSPPSGELDYPSTLEPQSRLPSRPTLLQSLTPPAADAGHNTCSASRPADAQETRSAELHLRPHLQLSVSSQHTSTALSAVPAHPSAMARSTVVSSSPVPSSLLKEQTFMSVSPPQVAMTSATCIAPATKRQMPLPATAVQHIHSSYAGLRALHARLVTSLSKLHPPDLTEALLRVQSANSYSVNALTTAHRSHILAQQSLATAQEAVAAAEESLATAETARTHVSDALTELRQLHSGRAGFDAEGSADWLWKVNYIQLQDDLRMLGEWLVEKEIEDGKGLDVDRQGAYTGNKAAEAVKCTIGVSGSDSHVVQDGSSELSHQVGVIQSKRNGEASLATSHPDLPSNRNLGHKRTLRLEAGTTTKASSPEQSITSRCLSPVIPESVPMEVNVDLPLKADGEMLQGARQPSQLNETPPSSTQHQVESFAHFSEDETCLRHEQTHSQYEKDSRLQPEEETRFRESREKLEVPTMQRKRMTPEELPESVANASGLKSHKKSAASKNTNETQPPRSQNSAADKAKRALQVHNDAGLTETIEQKRQTRFLLKERKQRELADPKKKEEELTAAEEQEMIAEQEKRRQEIMLQKQRATAETAARINAERARERDTAIGGASLQPPASSAPQPSLPDRPADSENLVTKKIMTSKSTKKLKSLSGGVKLGPNADGQPQLTAISNSLPLSPVSAGSATIGLPSLKAKTSVNTGPENVKVGNNNSRKATPLTEQSSQNLTMGTLRTSTPIDSMNRVEDLHVYRHSTDPGDLCVVPRSRVPPTSPEAQAANLRFVKDGNSVRRDAYSLPNPKSEFEHTDHSSLRRNSLVSVKKESPTPAPLIAPQTRRPIEPVPPKSVDHSLKYSLPAKPCPSVSLPPTRRHLTTDKDVMMDQRGVLGTTKAATAPSTIVPSYVPDTASAAPPPNTCHLPPNVTPPNPHRDNLSSPRINSKPLTTKSLNAPLTTPPATLDMTAIDPILPDDATHIAPVIHANGGWDRPADDETFSNESNKRELTPPQRPRLRRGGDHYSPPPRPPTPNPYARRSYAPRSISPAARSPLLPVQRSPILGKRRQREDIREDEHPPRRQRPMDGIHRTRSPPPHLRQTQRRSTTPDRPTLQARMQVVDHSENLHARLPSSRELAWRSPSPDRPALQTRIGVRDSTVHAINGSQSYRPTYPSDTYERPQFRSRDNYPSRPVDHSALGNRLGAEPEPRGPSYNRSRGSMNGNRGNRGGNRALNLEQRISSSAKPLTLINRLESPPRN